MREKLHLKEDSETKGLRYLLITPFSEEFQFLRQLIDDALKEVEIEPILMEETLAVGTPIVESVQQAIGRADVIIADLTGSNPNVMYEVGFAHALRKPILILVQHVIGHVPSDMAGYLYFVYDPSKPDELRRTIHAWAVRYLSERRHGETPG